MKLNLPIEDIINDYTKGTSASDLARQYGVSVYSIITRLRAAGVVIRTKTQNEKHLNPSERQPYTLREMIDGLLLGDGSMHGKGYLQISQCSAHADWLSDIAKHLLLVGCTSKIIPVKPRTRYIEEREMRSRGGWHLYTPVYEEFRQERLRWYPDGGKKLVPQDIKLTPMVVAQWLCGDGTGGKNGTLTFYTNGFDEGCVDTLVQKFHDDLQIHASKGATIRPGQFVVRVLSRGESVKLKGLIERYVPECFQYKLQHIHPAVHPKLLPEQVKEIRIRHLAGETPKDLAVAFWKSPQAIRTLLRGVSFKEGLVPVMPE